MIAAIFGFFAGVFHVLTGAVAGAYEAVTVFVPGGVVTVPAAVAAVCIGVVVYERRRGARAH